MNTHKVGRETRFSAFVSVPYQIHYAYSEIPNITSYCENSDSQINIWHISTFSWNIEMLHKSTSALMINL